MSLDNDYRSDFKAGSREFYWSFPRVVVALVVLVIAVAFIGFVATGGDYINYKFWAPKQENVRREVFENTQSYVQGKIETISQLELQYKTSTDADSRRALKVDILTEASNVDNDKLPLEMQGFIQGLKGDIQ